MAGNKNIMCASLAQGYDFQKKTWYQKGYGRKRELRPYERIAKQALEGHFNLKLPLKRNCT